MADTNIEWATKVWNPTRGCSRVSAGCGTGWAGGCYAERQAIRHAGPGGPYEGLVRIGKHGPSWTGVVRLIDGKLAEPYGWKKPERIFVNSMSDLFHEQLRWERDIDRVWNVMANCDRHAYLVLTKRAENMRNYVQDWYRRSRSAVLEQVWLGVSVEDQATADERIPLLWDTPAAIRFVSYEPALGPVDFSPWLKNGSLSWLIVGGESGPRARPFNVGWARSTIRDGHAAGVPVFVKQTGANVRDRNDVGFHGGMGDEFENEWPDHLAAEGRIEDCPNGFREVYQGAPVRVHLRDRKGGDMAEWPQDLRVREFPVGGQR